MFRNYIVPVIALAGIAFTIFTIVFPAKTPPPAAPVSVAPQSPYQAFVAGSGLVEASSENISIGTQIAGIVSKIYVHLDSDVKVGDPLFTIDERAVRAELATRNAAVQVAEAQLADAKYKLQLSEALAAERITSVEDREKNRFPAQKAEAQLAQARAELKSSETDLERLTVRAPVDGQVLQLKVHLGEIASVSPAAAGQQPLILLGSVTPLSVRVDVDENDASRVRTGSPAMGYVRGDRNINTPLKFVRFEPYIVPKKSLTGESTERVDTRVLQVIFSFERGELPIFVGQQMDVFIDASEPVQNGSTSTAKRLP